MNYFAIYLAALLAVPVTSLLAAACCNARDWYGVFGIESGVAITSDAGQSKTFPIKNSASDQFYKYFRRHKTQTQVIYGGFVGAEWQGLSHWNVQLDLNYNQSSPFSVKGTLVQGMDVQSQDSYQYKYKIMIRQLLVEGKVSYVNNTRLLPYALIGIGPSFNAAYSFSTTVPALLTFTRTYKSRTTTGLTYAVGAGLDIEILRFLRVGIGYRFTDFGKASLGSASINGTSVSGTLSQSHFYANEVLAQITFVF